MEVTEFMVTIWEVENQMNERLKKRLEAIEQKISPSPDKIVVVNMWTPDGQDGPTERRRIHLKASNKGGKK
jgi:hypothetical protein